MSGLTIASQAFEVSAFQEGPRVFVGETSRAFSGGGRSSVRAQKRTFTATTAYASKTDYDTLVSATANDVPVSVSGACLVGTTLTCFVRPTYKLVGIGTPVAGYNFMYEIALTIEEA